MKKDLLVLTLMAFSLTGLTVAGERSVYYEDEAGSIRVRVNMTNQKGSIGPREVGALSISWVGRSQVPVPLNLAQESLSELQVGEERLVEEAPTLTDEGSLVDLGGVSAQFIVEQVSACGGSLAASYTGTVMQGECFHL